MGIETALLSTILSATTATAAVGGTAYSMVQGSKAQEQASKAAKLERQAADLKAAKDRADLIRAGRIQLASSKNAAANQGALSSSSAQGAQASLLSQMNSGLSFLDGMQVAGQRISQAASAANAYAAKAQMGQDIASLGFSMAPYTGKAATALNKFFG